MSEREAKRLAQKLSSQMVGCDMPTCMTALCEVFAVCLLLLEEQHGQPREVSMAMLMAQALELAEGMTIERGPQDEVAAVEARIAALPTKPVKRGASPWGEVR
jgi:hypothetical protein